MSQSSLPNPGSCTIMVDEMVLRLLHWRMRVLSASAFHMAHHSYSTFMQFIAPGAHRSDRARNLGLPRYDPVFPTLPVSSKL